jgi:hypothetical protein
MMNCIRDIGWSPVSLPPPGIDFIPSRLGHGERPGGNVLPCTYLAVVEMSVPVVLSSYLRRFLPGILRRGDGEPTVSVVND